MPDARESVDLIVRGAAELATPRGSAAVPGTDMNAVLVVPRGAVAVADGRIAAVGTEAELLERYDARETLDARGGTLVPGFVDAHTHPVFRGTREGEFEMRTAGASYVEIASAGGGIASSLRGVREASREELVALVLARLDRFLEHGTTTVEAKTGYGLSLESERKGLEVLAEADRQHAVDVVATFLGAHDVPPEWRDDRGGYERLLVDRMIPEIAATGLARYFDIFTEAHVFDVPTSRRILTAAKDAGFELRMHVDQLTPLGGAQLAAELGAASADHLEHVTPEGIEALATAGVAPVLSPLVPLYLREEAQEAPARRMLDAGLPVALSTDFNPGSCYCQSMPEVLSWAALRYRMSAAECLTAATLNAAATLGRAGEVGTLEVGKRADVVVLDGPSHVHLVYELGRNPVRAVVVGGRVAWSRPGR